MKLPRTHIPIKVRLKVAERQLGRSWSIKGQSRTARLKLILKKLFPDGDAELDHNPALMLRKIGRQQYMDGGVIRWRYFYDPAEDDPDFLIYRKSADHRIKTIVRGDGAQRSDFAQRRYLKRLGKKTKKKFKPRRAKQIRRVSRAPITSSHGDKIE